MGLFRLLGAVSAGYQPVWVHGVCESVLVGPGVLLSMLVFLVIVLVPSALYVDSHE